MPTIGYDFATGDTFRVTSTGLEVALGKAIKVYNVGSPGATNYERGSIAWSSNIFTVKPEKGGTGSSRAAAYLSEDGTGWRILGSGVALLDGSAGGISTIGAYSDTIGLRLYGKTTTSTSVPSVEMINNPSGANFSASSGTQKMTRIAATTNQSGTAAFIGLEIDITPTATGSGSVAGLSIKRGGTEVFAIDTKAAPTSGNTVATLTYHNGGSVVHQLVTVGAADSGGAGFKLLRVPN